MSGLLLSGKTTEKPLYVQDMDINLYSMEELCFYLYNNVYMVGPDFFNESLLEFIGAEMGLDGIVKKLKDQIYRNESYINMIKTILESNHYYADREKENIIKVLKELEDKSIGERMKMRADLFIEKGRYESAIRAYKILLGKNYNIKDNKLIGSIWNNMGVIYAKMFLYEDALNCFKLAYDLYKKQEFLDNLICNSIIMVNLSEGENSTIEDLKTQYEISEDDIEKYKKAIELAEQAVMDEPEARMEIETLRYGNDKELGEYYKNTGEILKQWKKSYREQIH